MSATQSPAPAATTPAAATADPAVEQALAFVREQGVVLVSAKGPVPRLTERIAGGPIAGSWWAHPQGRRIYAILQAVRASGDVLACRLIAGKVTLVHRRLWPALARVAERFPAEHVAQVFDEHTPSGRHGAREVPFPSWLPEDVPTAAQAMTEEEALRALGAWTRNARLIGDASVGENPRRRPKS